MAQHGHKKVRLSTPHFHLVTTERDGTQKTYDLNSKLEAEFLASGAVARGSQAAIRSCKDEHDSSKHA